MDGRLPLKSLGMCLALLTSGCSPGEDKSQVSLEEKTAQFETSLEAIQDPKLKEAVTELGSSLLLLERAQLKLDSKPVETEYGEDVLAVLKHYPTPQALVDTYINGLIVLHKDSSSDYLTDLQPLFPFNFDIPAGFLFPHTTQWQSVTLSNKRVIAFQPEWSETDPGIQLSPSSSNVTNPDDLTVTYPFIDGLEVKNNHQPQPVSLQGTVEVIVPRRLYSFDLSKKDIGQTRSNDNLHVTLLKLTNNYAEIEYSNSAPLAPELADTLINPLIVQARDASGQFLSRAGSINQSAAQIAFYQKQLAEMQRQTAWSDAFEKQLDDELLGWMDRADCLLLDGTLWRDDEMRLNGVGQSLGRDMGHLAQSGAGGMLDVLEGFPRQRKVLIHINNTNPILDEDSPERAELVRRNVEVAYDGMSIEL